MYLKDTSLNTDAGNEMYDFISRLYPICRSITGNGVRQTLKIIGEHINLSSNEVPSGTKVFDWEVPREWNIVDAYIKNSRGVKIVDFKKSNLHVLNYSVPVHKRLSLESLKSHIFTLPDRPDWIPYRTSYYQDNWGFCMSHNQFLSLPDDEYEVFIDSSIEKGSLSYGEYYIRGESSDELLISTHTCHPSLCNDNLSGIALATFLAKMLSTRKNRLSYRFLFIPGTIGSIVWLHQNEKNLSRIKYGLISTLLGDDSDFTYKKTRQGDAIIDQVIEYVLKSMNYKYKIMDFYPYGYDERQYCSPGFNLPVGCLTRKPHGEFPEYHTSADNLSLIKPVRLHESMDLYLKIIDILEKNKTFLNLNSKCEPQLGKRGLYQKIGGTNESHMKQLAMLWVLNQSDGRNSLLDIAEKSNIPFHIIHEVSCLLTENQLLKERP